jgi:hypothetical protein
MRRTIGSIPIIYAQPHLLLSVHNSYHQLLHWSSSGLVAASVVVATSVDSSTCWGTPAAFFLSEEEEEGRGGSPRGSCFSSKVRQ